MQMSAAMMKDMKPEDLKRMQEMSTNIVGSGGGTGQPGISSILKNPDGMKQMMATMQAMSEDDLTNMMKMSKPGMDDATARQCAAYAPRVYDLDAHMVVMMATLPWNGHMPLCPRRLQCPVLITGQRPVCESRRAMLMNDGCVPARQWCLQAC
jgi:hypothetical protein